MNRFIQLFLVIVISSFTAFAVDTLQIRNSDVTIKALRLAGTIELDGKLIEDVWTNGGGFENFIQRDPVEGAPPTEKTIIKIAFDDNALYVGARMFDSSPDSITARLARRDEWVNSDHITIYLDPYYDRRSGYFFTVNAAGSLVDGVLYNDNWDDDSWDGVWEAEIQRDGKGWTAEMRIPFSQLRFNENKENVWGINFRRTIARKNERDFLVFIPKNDNGFVSHFADLKGLDQISIGGQMELTPYVTTRAEYLQHDVGDPFNDGSNYVPGLGADFKMGIGSNLTLNATINPDFGQVEIDPAVLNLSDVETFFDEKRPFFTEGSTIFNFGYGGARSYWGFNWGTPNFFYSRRIGRPPQGELPDNDYSDVPSGTHILGAAKLTGKIAGSWNFGTVQAITKREFAEIQYENNRSEVEIEPLTYYGVIRTQKEFDEGKQGLGFISTLSLRDFRDDRLRDDINQKAFSFGIDGWTFLDSSQTWVLAGWTGMSHVGGNTQRMINLQRNSRHYFQRPDVDHVTVDSTATSMTGYAGRFYLNKQKGNFFVNTAFGIISPKFDVNDMGFLWRSDRINWHAGAGYYWSDPTNVYRYLELGAAVFQNYDFSGNINGQGIFHFGYIETLDYYWANWNLSYSPEVTNYLRTRGGPLTLNPAYYQGLATIGTDSRKDWIIRVHGGYYKAGPSYDYWFETGLEFHPLPNLSIEFTPEFIKTIEHAQYIDTFEDPLAVNTFSHRYVFAELDQKTLSASFRLNWIFSPSLSLQIYVQPLISSGSYTNYKELAAARTYDFNIYGEGSSTFDEETNIADPDGNGPAEPIDVGENDFNFISLRGNAVLRWEYLPGSVVYFVWTQSREYDDEIGSFQFNKSMSRMVNIRPDNIFMVKFTYWFNM